MGSLEREQVSVGVDISQWGEGVFTMFKHVLGVMGGESACLGAQVKEDGIRFPASKSPDGSLVDSGDEQSGGSPGAGAVGGDAGRRDVSDVFGIGSGCLEFLGEHGGGDLVLCSVGIKVGVQWCVRRSGMSLEVQHLMLAGMDRAEDVITRESMSEGFTMCSILLVSVGEGDIHPCLHIIRGTLSGTHTLDVGTAEGDVSQSEGCAPSSLGGRGEGILTWLA